MDIISGKCVISSLEIVLESCQIFNFVKFHQKKKTKHEIGRPGSIQKGSTKYRNYFLQMKSLLQ